MSHLIPHISEPVRTISDINQTYLYLHLTTQSFYQASNMNQNHIRLAEIYKKAGITGKTLTPSHKTVSFVDCFRHRVVSPSVRYWNERASDSVSVTPSAELRLVGLCTWRQALRDRHFLSAAAKHPQAASQT
jgi:hypothetical protein